MNWQAAIDSWSAIHLLVWAMAAVIAVQWSRLRIVNIIRLSVAAGIGWEAIETFVEPLWGGHETFLNRWVFDIVADFLGTFFGLLVINLNVSTIDSERF